MAGKATLPQLAALIESGEVQFVFSHFTLSPQSQTAHEAAECAADQGRFWAFHETLLSKQSTGLGEETLRQIAAEVGLDTQAFGQCLTSGEHSQKVLQETLRAARELGVDSTPAFYLNGRRIEVQKSYDEVIAAVRKELGGP